MAKAKSAAVEATLSLEANKTFVHVVNGKDLKTNLNFDFNTRSPSRRSKAYISMRETLKDSPESFIHLNGGITVAGDHILDGGHTYLAIRDAISAGEVDPARIQIRVTEMGDLTKDEMAERSVALNRRVTPPLAGERDLLGHWDKLKAHTHPIGIYEFRPNTNPAAKYDMSMLIAMLSAWQSKTAEKSYSNKGGLVRLYHDDKYTLLLPLLPKMIEVYSAIYETLLGETKVINTLAGYNAQRVVTLPNGATVQGYLPEAYIWTIFGAFRSLIDSKGELTQDPIALLKSKKKAIIKTLIEDYKKSGSGPAKYGKDNVNYLNMTIAILGSK